LGTPPFLLFFTFPENVMLSYTGAGSISPVVNLPGIPRLQRTLLHPFFSRLPFAPLPTCAAPPWNDRLPCFKVFLFVHSLRSRLFATAHLFFFNALLSLRVRYSPFLLSLFPPKHTTRFFPDLDLHKLQKANCCFPIGSDSSGLKPVFLLRRSPPPQDSERPTPSRAFSFWPPPKSSPSDREREVRLPLTLPAHSLLMSVPSLVNVFGFPAFPCNRFSFLPWLTRRRTLLPLLRFVFSLVCSL